MNYLEGKIMKCNIKFNYTQDDLIELARRGAFEKAQRMAGVSKDLSCKETPDSVQEEGLEFVIEVGDK